MTEERPITWGKVLNAARYMAALHLMGELCSAKLELDGITVSLTADGTVAVGGGHEVAVTWDDFHDHWVYRHYDDGRKVRPATLREVAETYIAEFENKDTIFMIEDPDDTGMLSVFVI